MLKSIITKFLVYTREELDLWQTDSLKFFLHMKFLSNEVKGNFLREKAKGLIAALRLRLDPIFEQFCAYLH